MVSSEEEILPDINIDIPEPIKEIFGDNFKTNMKKFVMKVTAPEEHICNSCKTKNKMEYPSPELAEKTKLKSTEE